MVRRHLFIALSLAASVFCDNMKIFLWDKEDCKGENSLKPKLDLQLHVGCIKRGDVTQQLEVELEGEECEEKAVEVVQDGTMQAQPQAIVFFTSENCDPSTEITDAYLDDGCSNKSEKLKGEKWKSFEMRDASYGGLAGCNLDEEPKDGPICEPPLLPSWPGCGEPLHKPGK